MKCAFLHVFDIARTESKYPIQDQNKLIKLETFRFYLKTLLRATVEDQQNTA